MPDGEIGCACMLRAGIADRHLYVWMRGPEAGQPGREKMRHYRRQAGKAHGHAVVTPADALRARSDLPQAARDRVAKFHSGGVSLTPRAWRSKRATPSHASRLRTCWLTAVAVMPSSCAARAKLAFWRRI